MKRTDVYSNWVGNLVLPAIRSSALFVVSLSVRARQVRISLDLIKLAFRTPRAGICDPAVDVRFMPAGPVGADLDLRRERTLGNLAIDGGTGQPGPGKNGFQADDTLRFSHGRAASCWLFVTASETDRTAGAQEHFAHTRTMAFKRRKRDRSNPEAPAFSKIEAMGESQLVAEPAACFK